MISHVLFAVLIRGRPLNPRRKESQKTPLNPASGELMATVSPGNPLEATTQLLSYCRIVTPFATLRFRINRSSALHDPPYVRLNLTLNSSRDLCLVSKLREGATLVCLQGSRLRCLAPANGQIRYGIGCVYTPFWPQITQKAPLSASDSHRLLLFVGLNTANKSKG